MLLLFETPAGYALFKADKGLLKKNPDQIAEAFSTPEGAQKSVKLKDFQKFEDTTEALAAATAICDGALDKGLKKFLKNSIVKKEITDQLAVVDSKLGNLINKKLGIEVIYDNTVLELIRGIRSQLDHLVSGLTPQDAKNMRLGLSHSLCRYKLKFSPDKVDTMIVQAISLLDELDKELNTYAMRVREWYGWHFPEMFKVVSDNLLYAKTVRKMGLRVNCSKTDLSDILPEDMEHALKEAAEVSMGSEISAEDIDNIQALAEQVISISEYRASLYEYLKNRMNAIAPNLTVMVGELVGARLIAHAGSLVSLAKHPASTVQILGAEKALFRALKTKHDTPKYGLIYHASLVGQAAPKLKGKISRMLAAKTSLSIRMDALGDTEGVSIGLEGREKVEARLAALEGGKVQSTSSGAKGKPKQEKYEKPKNAPTFNPDADVVMTDETDKSAKKKKKEKKQKEEEQESKSEEVEEAPATDKKKEKKEKKRKREEEEAAVEEEVAAQPSEKKKQKKEKKKDKKDEE